MPYRYLPMLRSKAGEAVALQHLSAVAKQRAFPVIHLTVPTKAGFLQKLIGAWSGRSLAVDGTWNFGQTGSTAALAATVAALRAANVAALPCIEVDASAAYLAAVHTALAQAPGLGVVVKVRLNQIAQLTAWITAQGWPFQSIDLIVEAGYIPAVGHGVLNQVVINAINGISGHPWRTITLSSSAAPRDFGSLVLGPNLVDRLDWLLWQSVSPLVSVALDYADYGTSHPDMTEAPGFAVANATVSVKYTLDNHWLMVKGYPTRGRTGQPMAGQYQGHAVAVRSHPSFGGVPNCWADNRITQIASGMLLPSGRPITSGSRTSWVEIGMNRHLSLVSDRLP